MSRLLYILLISAITVAGFTMYQQQDIGHVSFRFGSYAFETNLIVFSSVLLLCLVLVLLANESYRFVKSSYHNIGKKRQKRLTKKAHLSLTKGLIEYAEGRFENAEKILLQQVKHSENAFLTYLTAARAAQQLGAHDRRDDYLLKAHVEAPDADLAIGLTKAELQLAHEQNVEALATLTHLNTVCENHAYVLTLLANTYKHLQDWDNLKSILPQLKKHNNLSAESFLSFEIAVCNGQLTKLAKTASNDNSGNQPLIDFWKDTASHLKIIPEVVEHYVKQLLQTGDASKAEDVLRQYINKNWHASSITLYSELDVIVDNKQLEMVASWLKDHPHDAYLLLALGNRCLSRSLWGKARSYLEVSLSTEPMPKTYLKLARLLEEEMNEPEAAQEYYRQGLLLLVDDRNADLLQKIEANDEEEPQLKIVKS